MPITAIIFQTTVCSSYTVRRIQTQHDRLSQQQLSILF